MRVETILDFEISALDVLRTKIEINGFYVDFYLFLVSWPTASPDQKFANLGFVIEQNRSFTGCHRKFCSFENAQFKQQSIGLVLKEFRFLGFYFKKGANFILNFTGLRNVSANAFANDNFFA